MAVIINAVSECDPWNTKLVSRVIKRGNTREVGGEKWLKISSSR